MIIALAGLAGAGKTTAVKALEREGAGSGLYVGSFVTDEVRRRGLPPGADSERTVRSDMRSIHGMDVLARAAVPAIQRMVAAGPVLIDAIYCDEERRLYLDVFGSTLVLLAVDASNELRAARLAGRPERPIASRALAERDEYELGTLRLDEVMRTADRRIANEGTLDDFEGALQGMLAAIR